MVRFNDSTKKSINTGKLEEKRKNMFEESEGVQKMPALQKC